MRKSKDEWSNRMKSFEFKLYGGFTLTFDKETLTIDVKGVKGLFFQRVKPRHKVIPLDQILRIDYKGAGMTIGVYCKIKVQTSAKNLYRVLHYFCA